MGKNQTECHEALRFFVLDGERSSTGSVWTQITKYFINPSGSKKSKCLSSSSRLFCSLCSQNYASDFTNRRKAKQFAFLEYKEPHKFGGVLCILRFVTLRRIELRLQE
jgi:hypothetical protein